MILFNKHESNVLCKRILLFVEPKPQVLVRDFSPFEKLNIPRNTFLPLIFPKTIITSLPNTSFTLKKEFKISLNISSYKIWKYLIIFLSSLIWFLFFFSFSLFSQFLNMIMKSFDFICKEGWFIYSYSVFLFIMTSFY